MPLVSERTKRVAHPKLRKHWNQRRRFLAQFVKHGDLVFDVGANQGAYTRTFKEMGARPVAIEPIPELAEKIRSRVRGAPIIQAAASDTEGETELFVGDTDAPIPYDEVLQNATASPGYAAVVEHDFGVKLHPITVPTITLDAVERFYGVPDFVKIDVEGHEPAVLRGMTFDPPALSIEAHGAMLDAAEECLTLLEERGYTFRLSEGFSLKWTGQWQPAKPLLAHLTRVARNQPHLFADIYARTDTPTVKDKPAPVSLPEVVGATIVDVQFWQLTVEKDGRKLVVDHYAGRGFRARPLRSLGERERYLRLPAWPETR